MRLAVAIGLTLLCSQAWAADPFVPFRKLFPGPRAPVEVAPLPSLPPAFPPVVVLPEPEPSPPAIDPPDPKSPVMLPMPRPKVRPKQPLSLAACEGPPLTRSCQEVCDYATKYTYAELKAMRAVGIASGWIENRPISCQEDRMGKACIAKYCRNTVKK